MLQAKPIRKKTPSKRTSSRLKRPSQLLYATVRDRILDDLKKTDLKPGDRYFTEGELTLRYDVSRNTVRRAMAELEERGYLTRQRGLGNFIPHTSPASTLQKNATAKGKYFERGQQQNTARPLVLVLPEWDDSMDGFYSGKIIQELTTLTSEMNLVIQIHNYNDFKTMGDPQGLPIVAIDPTHETILRLSKLALDGAHVLVIAPAYTIPTAINLCDTLEQASRMAVKRFVQLGHRHVGIINHDTCHHDFCQTLEGFLEAHRELQLPIHPHAIVQNYKGKVASIPIDPCQITAWICTYNGAVNLLADRCRDEGLSIPQDVSLICFDGANEQMTAAVGKRISVIRPDARHTARAILTCLQDWQSHDLGKVIALPMQSMKGQTIAPAKVSCSP